MHTKRLFLQDLTDEHLTLLLKVIQYSVDIQIEDWLDQLQTGYLAVYEIADGKGLVGLKRRGDSVFVEFLVGEDLKPYTHEIVAWLKEIAEGKTIEAFVTRKGLVKYYAMLGFKNIGTWMRF